MTSVEKASRECGCGGGGGERVNTCITQAVIFEQVLV